MTEILEENVTIRKSSDPIYQNSGKGPSPHTARHCKSVRKESSITKTLVPGHFGTRTTGPHLNIKHHAITNCGTQFHCSSSSLFRHLRFNLPSLYILGQEPPRNRVNVEIPFPRRKLIPPATNYPINIRTRYGCQVFVFNYRS